MSILPRIHGKAIKGLRIIDSGGLCRMCSQPPPSHDTRCPIGNVRQLFVDTAQLIEETVIGDASTILGPKEPK